MSNVLITGAGNVGASIGREFVDKGFNVIFYDSAAIPVAATADFIKEVNNKVTFIVSSVLDYESLLKAVENHNVEGIINTALITKNSPSFKDRWYSNIEATENVLEIAKPRGLKVININSAGIYGAVVSSGRWPLGKLLTEEDLPQLFPMAPAGPYDQQSCSGYSCIRRIQEELINFYFQEYGMHVCSMRLGSVYGLLDTKIHLINVMIRRALAKKPFEINNGGDHVEDHVYNKDLAKAVYSAFMVKKLKRSVYNITSGKIWSHRETAEIIMKVIPGSILKLGPGMFSGGSFGVSYIRPPISIKAAQDELGYKVTSLELGIKETAEWMKKNWDFVPNGYFEVLPDSWWVK